MDNAKKAGFVKAMGKRPKFAKGGPVYKKGRQHLAAGGPSTQGVAAGIGSGASTGAAIGSIIPGIGTVAGGIVGGIAGLIGGLLGGSAPQMPNITDPVTGQQITDAQGNVVANQQTLQGFIGSLQGQNGVANQQAVFTHLNQIANGQGPNPALDQLKQETSTNVANQAALQAGQRGAAGNVGLMARQIGQQGAATQQQAVGQASTLAANQELNAINSQGQIAGQQVGELQGAIGTAGEQGLANQGQILGAQQGYNTNITGGTASANSTNASNLGTIVPAVVGLGKGVATGTGNANLANGTLSQAPAVNTTNANPVQTAYRGGRIVEGPHKSHVMNFLMAKGGAVPAMVSPGEIYLSPEAVKKVIHEDANPFKVGEKIGGKARVKGDSLKNDTVPKTLEEGGVVLPRHISATSKMSKEKAQLFVHKSMAKKKAGK